MRDRTVRRSCDELAKRAGEEKLLGEATVVEIVHQEGTELIKAGRKRAEEILNDFPEARAQLLATSDAPEIGPDGRFKDDPAAEFPHEADEEVLRTAVGFLGVESLAEAEAVEKTRPREVDENFVCVQPDEVKVKAQAGSGCKEHWVYTATVMVGKLRYYFAEASPGQLWPQVASVLCLLGVLSGERQLLVLGDGAIWIRNWFEGLQLSGKVMILCWYHLAKRCYQRLSAAGFGSKERRQAVEHELLGYLWRGELDQALAVLAGVREEVRNPKWIDDMVKYLEKRREYLPNYSARHAAGLWIASNRVEKWNDWAVSDRCQRRGMSWAETGVLSLAVFQAARYNGELETWRAERQLPAWRMPEPMTQAV
jgi:hypothetical protein